MKSHHVLPPMIFGGLAVGLTAVGQTSDPTIAESEGPNDAVAPSTTSTFPTMASELRQRLGQFGHQI